MKVNNPRGPCVGLMMRLALVSLTLALGAVQAVPAADCLCGPGCDGRTHRAPAEAQSCCDHEVPTPLQPCACFHRAPPDPGTLEMSTPPSISPVAAEAPPSNLEDRVRFDILPISDSWRADQARGSPLHLLHSVLLI